MESEFRELGPTLVLDRQVLRCQKLFGMGVANFWSRFRRISRFRRLRTRLNAERIGLVYSNTSTNGDLLRWIAFLNCPVITHVHELEQLIRASGARNVTLVHKHTQHYIAASEAVKTNLVSHHGIPVERMEVIHSAIPGPGSPLTKQLRARSEILDRLNVPVESLVVGACGATCMHKGTDLFVELAKMIHEQHPRVPVCFIWVGPETRRLTFSSLQRKANELGLRGLVHFVGNQKKPLDYFAVFDVFAMTSREDAFGLAMLEAASLEKPIVCFGCAGGAKEFVEDDCGFVIPDLDVSLMAQKTMLLLESKSLCDKFGQCAARKLRERHTIEVAAPRIMNVIEHFLIT
jgi:glycosyltransferase involved in cell wall biosynthesis